MCLLNSRSHLRCAALAHTQLMASQLETAMMQLRDLQRQIRKKELLEEQSRILDAIAEETKASREAEQSAVQYSAWLY